MSVKIIIKQSNRKTSIPRSVARQAAEKVYRSSTTGKFTHKSSATTKSGTS